MNKSIHSSTIVELEESMIPVKAAMESRGLRVALPKLEALISETTQTKQALEDGIKADLGLAGDVN